MSNELAKMALLSLLPPGSAWNVKENGDWDALLEGQATNWETVRVELDKLSEIRNPLTTPLLDDLEREYGVTPNPELTDTVRRQRLASLVYAPDGTGSASYLEARLQDAGFDVRVHSNDPAVDPIPYLDTLFGMQLGEAAFQLGEPESLLGSYTSELIVAGDIFRQEFDFLAQCGATGIQCGTAAAVCGSASFDISPVEYPDPTDPNRWRYVFFIGGTAERNIFLDGDMERADLKFYNRINGSLLEKDTSLKFAGSRALKISGNAGAPGFVGAQSRLTVPDGTTTFTVTGKAIPNGFGSPTLYQSDTPGQLGTVRWLGTTTGVWQDVTPGALNVADGLYITLAGNSAQAIVNFDNMECLIDNAPFGEIQSIESAEIPSDRRDEFLSTVTKWKPMHTWGIAIVEWTS